jgi:hypothetical protein
MQELDWEHQELKSWPSQAMMIFTTYEKRNRSLFSVYTKDSKELQFRSGKALQMR